MDQKKLANLIEPKLCALGLELDGLEVIPAGKRCVLRVIVDGDGDEGTGLTMDDIATATRAVSAVIDDSDAVGKNPFTLEVSSRGVSRPLTRPAHYRRNVSRLIKIVRVSGETVKGRIVGADEHRVVVDHGSSQVEIEYSDVKKAMIEVELKSNSAEQENK